MDRKTSEVLEIFKKISAVPRCSGREEGIAKWLEAWAQKRGLPVRIDSAGNVAIKVPATNGDKTAPPVILQGHLDMVCEKTPASHHDFSKDPICPVREGDWLKADGTTLGADNGIGIALCLDLAQDESLSHPPLELLFTVEEETGLTGAESLGPGFVEGKVLINIDSEEEGVFTVGSAGGKMLSIELPTAREPASDTLGTCRLQIQGLRGGHSGVDIHKRRGNANKILAGALDALKSAADIKLLSISGGTRSNAIPRDAEAMIACAPDRVPALQHVVAEFQRTAKREYAASENSLSVTLTGPATEGAGGDALVSKDFDTAISLLSALPDGVVAMSPDIPGLVETSNNIATVELRETVVVIQCFQRSSVKEALDRLTSTMESLSARAGARVKNDGEFPPWEPNMNSPLLAQCRKVYRDLFKAEPQVSAVHAGLECGIIGAKYPGLDMISLGPTIENPHSPDERLHIPSVGKIRDFLAAFLRSYEGPA